MVEKKRNYIALNGLCTQKFTKYETKPKNVSHNILEDVSLSICVSYLHCSISPYESQEQQVCFENVS